MPSAKVAILRTRPETVLDDTLRLFELGGGPEHLDRTVPTVLKDNISWHYPFPSGHRQQWEVCNLYPLLIHLNLFGKSYLGNILHTIQRF